MRKREIRKLKIKQKRRIRRVVGVGFLLSLLTLPVCFAGYKTESRLAVTARAASFQIEVSECELLSSDDELDFCIPNDQVEYEFSIRNISEVDVLYNTEILNCPDGIKVIAEEAFGELLIGEEKAVRVKVAAGEGELSGMDSITGVGILIHAVQEEPR